MSKQSAWLITAKTKLHVGNENTSNYGLIDKAVQRDVLTGLPCINSSSLKGAINEYCTQFVGMDKDDRIKIFGVDKGNKESETKKGSYTFFDGNILLLPVQNETTMYHWVTTRSIIKRFKEQLDTFGIMIQGVTDEDGLLEKIKTQFRDHEIIIKEDAMMTVLCSDTELPIIARNCLDDVQNPNLWYEQVLPPETVFYTQMLTDEDILSMNIKDKIIQIGANATIGYGYCRLTEIV